MSGLGQWSENGAYGYAGVPECVTVLSLLTRVVVDIKVSLHKEPIHSRACEFPTRRYTDIAENTKIFISLLV